MREARAPLLRRLSFLEPLRHHLEHVPRDRRVRLDERAEVPGRHPVTGQIALGLDRRRPVDVGDQRDLAEVVTGAERPYVRAADADFRGAVADHEEADSALSFLGDLLAGAERTFLHRLCDLLELAVA